MHEFVRRVEHCLDRKKPALGIFLDSVGAFDYVTFRGFVAALQVLGMSKIFTSWIENLLRHRTVQVELYGDKANQYIFHYPNVIFVSLRKDLLIVISQLLYNDKFIDLFVLSLVYFPAINKILTTNSLLY